MQYKSMTKEVLFNSVASCCYMRLTPKINSLVVLNAQFTEYVRARDVYNALTPLPL